jgi:hypothetical protein
MNGIVLSEHVVCCDGNVISLFFLDVDVIASSLFLDIFGKLGPSLQLNSSTDILSIQLDSILVHFAHMVHDCLNMNFSLDELEEDDQLCPPPPPNSHGFGFFFGAM